MWHDADNKTAMVTFPNSKQALVIAAIAVVLFVVLVLPVLQKGPVSGETKALAAVEVRSYQGKPLSSITDFHENSILGPQHINESDYLLTVTGLTTSTKVSTVPGNPR